MPLSGTPSGQNTFSTPPLSGTPSEQNTSSPPHLRCSLALPVDKIPPQLCCFLVLPVDKIPTQLFTSGALWYPQWTKYLLTSSTPLLFDTPSGQNTSSPPQLRCSLAPQWTKYLLTSSTLLLSGTPSGQNTYSTLHLQHSLVPPVDKIAPHLLTSSTLPFSGTPSGQNTSSPPQLHCSLAPQVDIIPPHLLNSAALWYPQWTKYLLNSSPRHSLVPPVDKISSQLLTSLSPHLHCSLVPPVNKIPPHLLTSTPLWYPQWTKYLLSSSLPHLLPSSTPHLLNSSTPHLLNSTTLWHHKWTKYLLTSSTPLLSDGLSSPHHAFWRRKWRSLMPLVALSGPSRGNLLCSLAPLAEIPTKKHFILLMTRYSNKNSVHQHTNYSTFIVTLLYKGIFLNSSRFLITLKHTLSQGFMMNKLRFACCFSIATMTYRAK